MSKKKTNYCPGRAQTWDMKFRFGESPPVQREAAAWEGIRPRNMKRLRMTCPVCKRRLKSSVSTCHDGCCLLHTLPPHKPKGWKRPGRRKSKDCAPRLPHR